MSRRQKRIVRIVAAALSLLLLALLIDTSQSGATPVEAVHVLNEDDAMWTLNRVLAEAEMPDGSRLVFWENRQSAILVSQVEKRWNGRWKVDSSNGSIPSVPTPHDEQPGAVMFLNFYEENDLELSIIWGAAYDTRVASVQVDTTVADFATGTAKPRIWYMIRDDALSQTHPVRFFAEDGSLLGTLK